jgi:hypothetical protein
VGRLHRGDHSKPGEPGDILRGQNLRMFAAMPAVAFAVDLLRLFISIENPVVRLIANGMNPDLETSGVGGNDSLLQVLLSHLRQTSLVRLIGERLEQQSRA